MKKFFILLCSVFLLAGCGKRGRLDFPPQATYPRQYPAPRKPVVTDVPEQEKPEKQIPTLLDINDQIAE